VSFSAISQTSLGILDRLVFYKCSRNTLFVFTEYKATLHVRIFFVRYIKIYAYLIFPVDSIKYSLKKKDNNYNTLYRIQIEKPRDVIVSVVDVFVGVVSRGRLDKYQERKTPPRKLGTKKESTNQDM